VNSQKPETNAKISVTLAQIAAINSLTSLHLLTLFQSFLWHHFKTTPFDEAFVIVIPAQINWYFLNRLFFF